jgi:hypothetical protein
MAMTPEERVMMGKVRHGWDQASANRKEDD